jgi:hypothetical protein
MNLFEAVQFGKMGTRRVAAVCCSPHPPSFVTPRSGATILPATMLLKGKYNGSNSCPGR